ncbi:MAG: transposase [Anaerolineae bacterium]|nr:transposase [Anaerolineae bacterium]
MSRTSYKFLEGDINPYFVTSTVVDWLPLLAIPEIAKIILDSLAFLQKEKQITFYAYVIMKTHLHLIASADNISKEIANLRSYTARISIDYFKEHNQQDILHQLSKQKLAHRKDRDHQFWQEGVQPKRIHDRKMMHQKILYIHENPVRKGYVEKSEDWVYSSAGCYDGNDGLLNVFMDW